jgi:hypothetical protein
MGVFSLVIFEVDRSALRHKVASPPLIIGFKPFTEYLMGTLQTYTVHITIIDIVIY